jgi:hypothetical protein
MAKTPMDLAPLVEAILTPEARRKVPEGGFESVVKGGWEGMRIGFVESTWGTGNEEKWGKPASETKWGKDPVVSFFF